MFVQISRKTQFTIHTTYAGYAAFSIDHIHFYLWRHNLVHGEHITHIRVARVSPSLACRISDHFTYTLDGLFRRGGKFDVIVQTHAHLVLSVDAHYFPN